MEQFVSDWSEGKARYKKSTSRNGSRSKEVGVGKNSDRRKEKLKSQTSVGTLYTNLFAFLCIILCVELLWLKYGQTCCDKSLKFIYFVLKSINAHLIVLKFNIVD